MTEGYAQRPPIVVVQRPGHANAEIDATMGYHKPPDPVLSRIKTATRNGGGDFDKPRGIWLISAAGARWLADALERDGYDVRRLEEWPQRHGGPWQCANGDCATFIHRDYAHYSRWAGCPTCEETWHPVPSPPPDNKLGDHLVGVPGVPRPPGWPEG